MSQTLTIELSDVVYKHLRTEAEASGTSPARLVIAAVEQTYGNGHQEREASRGAVRRFFGAYHSGRPSGADNEQIDADLAREYGNNHESG